MEGSAFLIFVILAFIFSVIIVYHNFPEKLSKYSRFDILILFIIFSLFGARIIGLIGVSDFANMQWSLNPLVQEGEFINIFSSWPWVIIRFWDNAWNFQFPILLYLFSILLLLLFISSKYVKYIKDIINNLLFGNLFFYFFILLFEYIFNVDIYSTEVGFATYSNIFVGLLIYILIFMIIIIKRVYTNLKGDIGFVIFGWGIINIFLVLIHNNYIPFKLGVDMYYVEYLISIGVGLVILLSLFINRYVRYNGDILAIVGLKEGDVIDIKESRLDRLARLRRANGKK